MIIMLCITSLACAATVASGNCGAQGSNVTWVLDDTGTLTISGTGAMKDCGEYLDDIPWYYNVEEIEAVIIDNGVTSIGDSAFSGCDSLTSITIPASVTSIENHAFGNCSNLRSITIPNNVTSIGDYAFANCSNLRSITIPNSVTSIGYWTFNGCGSLVEINVDANNSVYMSENGILFNKKENILERYPSGKKDEHYVIPDGVTSIGEGAFSGCSSLTSITVPNSVTSIDNGAFEFCSSLVSVTIPDGLTKISAGTFLMCDSLTNITIPNSITSIGGNAFSVCKNLTSITIPNSVTSIEDYAFAGCSNLTSITIPNSITNIKPQSFYSCQNVKDIYYNGSESEWKKFSIALDKKFLLNATIHFVDKQSNNQISIVINGKRLNFSQAPYMANNTTMVPMRVIFEALGADVNYDSASQKITATKGDTVIELVLGQKTAKKNGESIALDAAAVTKNGNTMVPLRFVAEALQAQVNWDGATQTVSISSEN